MLGGLRWGCVRSRTFCKSAAFGGDVEFLRMSLMKNEDDDIMFVADD